MQFFFFTNFEEVSELRSDFNEAILEEPPITTTFSSLPSALLVTPSLFNAAKDT